MNSTGGTEFTADDLARLARDGVLLTEWAHAAGWPPGRVKRRLRSGRWQPICRGAWAPPGVVVDWEHRARALQLLQPRLVCSHRSAAVLHRIELLDGPRATDPVELTDPHPALQRRRPGTLVRLIPLDACDVTVRKGLRVTTPVRTVGDVIRLGSRDEAVVAADSALSRRRVRGVVRPPLIRSPGLLREELLSKGPTRKGSRRASLWLPLVDPLSGSPAETVARLRMHDAGLHPETQVPLCFPTDGRTLRPDFLFRPEGLAVEVEGYAFHGTREAHERDTERFNRLASHPEVRRALRFTAATVLHRPHEMIATVQATLAELRDG
ncbi:hypothetical protein [Streptomyces sp. CC208A]|uniref:hypothetical protein n=1 Tax=Streptomyces sp. CC208A TaxID=3044573 RepID=UPI0024A83157|nr:hypothetical protein [Streptomyces sp. CC208A]